MMISGAIRDDWLDAWGDVEWSCLTATGERGRYGLVIQQVKAAFEAHGLDAFETGILYDNGRGGIGLRYDEAQAIEAAWVRRELSRLTS